MKYKAIFIDKDGTLIKDIPYNVDPEKIEFEDGVVEGLSLLSNSGYKLIIVSNQSGVGRGYFKPSDLIHVYERMQSLLQSNGIDLDDFYFCPHLPAETVSGAGGCYCRKPSPGLIITASLKHNIDLTSSWMIGDILTDIEAGKRASCRTILINNGNETIWNLTEINKPDYYAGSFLEAAKIVTGFYNKIFA